MMIKFVFMLVCVTMLVACGYQLRTHVLPERVLASQDKSRHDTTALTVVYLTVDGYDDFYQNLTQKLDLLGVGTLNQDQATTQNIKNRIDVSRLKLQTYELVGVLSEVRLVLSADISYHIYGKTYQTSIQVSRSYQHNEASVTATDAQAVQVEAWLYDSLASRISEQYYALYTQVHE